MKNTVLLLAMMTMASFVYGQNSSFDLSFQLGNSYRSLQSSEGAFTGNDIIDSQGLHERKMNYSIELGYNYKINNQWVVKTGVNYTTLNYFTSKLTDLRWPSDFDENGGFTPDPDLPRELINSIDHTFVGVPLLIRYQFSNTMISPYLEVGPSLMVLAGSNYNNNISVGTEITEVYNTINVFGRATIGLNYTLSNQAQMFGGITYNQQLNNIWQEDFSERLNSYGLQVGMRVKFGSQSSCCKPKSCCSKAEKVCEKPE